MLEHFMGKANCLARVSAIVLTVQMMVRVMPTVPFCHCLGEMNGGFGEGAAALTIVAVVLFGLLHFVRPQVCNQPRACMC